MKQKRELRMYIIQKRVPSYSIEEAIRTEKNHEVDSAYVDTEWQEDEEPVVVGFKEDNKHKRA